MANAVWWVGSGQLLPGKGVAGKGVRFAHGWYTFRLSKTLAQVTRQQLLKFQAIYPGGLPVELDGIPLRHNDVRSKLAANATQQQTQDASGNGRFLTKKAGQPMALMSLAGCCQIGQQRPCFTPQRRRRHIRLLRQPISLSSELRRPPGLTTSFVLQTMP
jgi:hypothetical protein